MDRKRYWRHYNLCLEISETTFFKLHENPDCKKKTFPLWNIHHRFGGFKFIQLMSLYICETRASDCHVAWRYQKETFSVSAHCFIVLIQEVYIKVDVCLRYTSFRKFAWYTRRFGSLAYELIWKLTWYPNKTDRAEYKFMSLTWRGVPKAYWASIH